MGNVCVSADAADDGYRASTAKPASRPTSGAALGGDAKLAASLSPREAAAAAAEARFHASGGAEASARQRREVLIGRIEEQYARRRQDAPLGLRTMTLQQLEKVQQRLSPATARS
jgi:hypothetical protein